MGTRQGNLAGHETHCPVSSVGNQRLRSGSEEKRPARALKAIPKTITGVISGQVCIRFLVNFSADTVHLTKPTRLKLCQNSKSRSVLRRMTSVLSVPVPAVEWPPTHLPTRGSKSRCWKPDRCTTQKKMSHN